MILLRINWPVYQKIFLSIQKSGGQKNSKYHVWFPGKFPGVIWPPDPTVTALLNSYCRRIIFNVLPHHCCPIIWAGKICRGFLLTWAVIAGVHRRRTLAASGSFPAGDVGVALSPLWPFTPSSVHCAPPQSQVSSSIENYSNFTEF